MLYEARDRGQENISNISVRNRGRDIYLDVVVEVDEVTDIAYGPKAHRSRTI